MGCSKNLVDSETLMKLSSNHTPLRLMTETPTG